MDAIVNPWTVITDTREQTPWTFEGITQRRKKCDVPLTIPTEVARLESGDYSIKGYERGISIERKSAHDLISTISHHRDRFERELTRLNQLDFAAVVVEAEWATTLKICERTTKFNPRSLDSSVVAWMQRYPGVHWLWRPGRFCAAKTAFKVLDRYWRDHRDGQTSEEAA